MPLIFGNTKLILNAFNALVHEAPGTASLAYHQSFIDANNGTGTGAAIYVAALDGLFANESTASLATIMRTNLGITAVCTQAVAEAYLTAFASNRVGAILNLADQLSNYSGSDTAILAAKANYNATIVDSYNYTTSGVSVPGKVLTTGSHDFVLTSSLDNLTGTTGDDLFTARLGNLNNADVVKGGLGLDTLFADIGTIAAITPETTGIETVQIRAQYSTDFNDSTDNNTVTTSEVQIDAQRMQGVTQWESNNSRADLVIEDVRILDSQITKDITIAMVETDPGHVDFGVYFDQHSLRNVSASTSSINLQVMDTVSAAAGTAPLLNSTYGAFTFTATTNGVSQVITLASQAIQDAQTYVELVAAFQAALDAQFGAGAASAVLGADFTVVDPASGIACTGKSVLITANSAIAYTTPAGSGWSSQGTAPASSNFYTNYNTAATTAVDLVTSKVILDDVGRGSTGGDLVIGGLSTGITSGSQGVGRFEIEVRDNSKLETIQSTNNTLKEVTIKNGATSSFTDAYTVTVKDAGNLTVNGNSGLNGGYVGDGKGNVTDPATGVNAPLPGTTSTASGVTSSATAAGFTDVRLIDASTMTGKLAFTADFTDKTITKYLNLKDIQALPAGDNIAVTYTGGVNDDTMIVRLDAAAVSSNNKIVAGREDFTFNFNGGTGNDKITVSMANGLQGGDQAWYTNEKLNANVFIDAGEGNDIIKTPGAGDVVIKAGAGDDTVYTDNTGALTTALATGTAGTGAVSYANAAAAELAAAQAAAVASNTTGIVYIAGGEATGAWTTTLGAFNALNTLDLVTPAAYAVAPPVLPLHSVMVGAINTATASGGLTFAQNIALNAAYGNTGTAGVVTPATTMVNQSISGFVATPDGTVMTQAQFDAGNALLATYIAEAKAKLAFATSSDTNAPVNAALLDGTQLAVVNATQAVNKVFDPSAAGLTYTVGAITQGTNETNTFTAGALAAGNTNIINGLTFTAGAGGATAAQVATAMSGGAVAGGVLTGANNAAAWTVALGAGNTLVYTSAVTGNPANLADTGVGAPMAAPVVVAAVAEVVPVTITGTGAAGETVTFDGITHNVAGLNAAAVAALIDAEATDTTFTDAAVGAVVTFTSAIAGVRADVTGASFGITSTAVNAGTQTTVTNLAALNTALVSGATDAQIVTALQTAIANGAITAAQANALFAAAVATAGTVDGTELLNAQAILVPIQTTAANLNTAAQATLTAAVTANNTAVNQASTAASFDALVPVIVAGGSAIAPNDVADSNVANDSVGWTEAAAAVATAQAALDAAKAVAVTGFTAATKAASDLAALKAAIVTGSTDLAVVTATANAVANGSITAGDKIAIDAAASAVTGVVGVAVTAAEKIAVDLLITAKQVTNDILVADATLDTANLQAIVDATTTASTIAAAAAASGGASGITAAAPMAVFVFDTSNQTSSYNRVTMDDRNLADLKSDANNTYNFFNSTVKVSYKGIDVSVVVAGTGAKTSDLEINQAIKKAINDNAVLKMLLVAEDGPANSLVVKSLIDGVQTVTDLSVSVTLPTTVTAAEVTAAIAAGVVPAAATSADLLTAMAAAKVLFDAKGDYTTQFAESGAAGGNTALVGANSHSSSDNTITLGTGNDVLVLGTTVETSLLTSSNEKVVYNEIDFGNDTIVHFAAAGLGIDQFDFTALKGSGAVAFNSLSLNKSIVVAAETLANDTAAEIAALFTDSATAIDHIYVAYDAHNVGKVYQVADAAGVAAGNVTAKLIGTIDLADTGWATLTAANFA